MSSAPLQVLVSHQIDGSHFRPMAQVRPAPRSFPKCQQTCLQIQKGQQVSLRTHRTCLGLAIPSEPGSIRTGTTLALGERGRTRCIELAMKSSTSTCLTRINRPIRYPGNSPASMSRRTSRWLHESRLAAACVPSQSASPATTGLLYGPKMPSSEAAVVVGLLNDREGEPSQEIPISAHGEGGIARMFTDDPKSNRLSVSSI